MSDSEEDNVYYGTPLEPYDEDAFPKKKPISIEEQVARDEQGRRRFHGAFTGGFSAGFFNTVGSLEGWRPAEFKSSRGDKAQNRQQKPEDYMDHEDLSEFGIAPQTVRATDDFATSKKRKKKVFADGPIPGVPVLETLLQAGNETVGYFLMRNMNRKKREEKTGQKVYGCAMPTEEPEEPEEVPQYKLHDFYKQYLAQPKCNSFGMGHVGLDKTHVNLFQPAKLTVRERNNKKLSISGQAFGVGAFEEDDDDIYVKDDMTRYDFELTAESSKKEPSQKVSLIMDLFVQSSQVLRPQNNFPPPVIPSSFCGKHNVKRSRFEPVPEAPPPERTNIDASVRARYLGEDGDKTYTPSGTQHRKPKDKQPESSKTHKNESKSEVKTDHSNILKDMFVSSTLDDDPTNLLEPVKKMETPHGTEEMHAAVKMKMFGPLTRVTLDWQPCSFLCRRFNVPEPNSEFSAQKNRKRTKHLIFEYQKHAESEPVHKPGLSIQNQPDSSIKSELDHPAASAVPPEPPEADSSAASEAPVKKQPSPEPSTSNSGTSPEEAQDRPAVDITDKLDVARNTDLFKAVFLSSSESESEGEEEKDTEQRRQQVLAANVVSEPLVPKIKSTKEGILSNIDFSKFQARKSEPEPETEKKEPKRDENMYGPKLPESISKSTDQKVKAPAVEGVDDEWVEKDAAGRKHKKKHKNKEKEKDRHKKKHKHKSKR